MSLIILASGSPRRKEILEQVGLAFEICPAKGEEVITKTKPDEVVLELSEQKAKEVASGILSWLEEKKLEKQDILVIGADTIVAFGGRILGKPRDEEDAKRMLRMLSGNTHSVYTGVCCVFLSADGKCGMHSFYEKTDVSMYPMTEDAVCRYVETGEPMDKAGAYAIQGRCAIHIKEICGDYYNVVGFPIARLFAELQALGIDLYMW